MFCIIPVHLPVKITCIKLCFIILIMFSSMCRGLVVGADLNIVLSKYPLCWAHVTMMEIQQNISTFSRKTTHKCFVKSRFLS